MWIPLLAASAFASPCPPMVPGTDISKGFPSMIGQELRMRAEIDRSLDITTALVVADGERFAVLLTPEHLWTGTEEKVFAVLGSTVVPIHGSTRLPHLMLVTEPRCTATEATPDAKSGG